MKLESGGAPSRYDRGCDSADINMFIIPCIPQANEIRADSTSFRPGVRRFSSCLIK